MPEKRQLLFVQGGGEGTHEAWDDKLVASLQRELGPDYEIRYPRMPREDEPDYARWKPALEQALDQLRDGAVLVGHSVGGTISIKLLSERPSSWKLRGVFLIAAPFLGDGGWSSDDLHFPQELGARLPAGVALHFFHGMGDDTVPPTHLELYGRAIAHARIHRLPGLDHQFNNDLKAVAQAIVSLDE